MLDPHEIAILLRQLADNLEQDTPADTAARAQGAPREPSGPKGREPFGCAPQPNHLIISTVTARTIAQQRGIHINPSTLRMAATRGSIPGAHKRGGRWYLPRDAFQVWLDNFTPRT